MTESEMRVGLGCGKGLGVMFRDGDIEKVMSFS